MALARAYEEAEVAPDVRRVYEDVRASLDLPFVPTVFKLAAGRPAYLNVMWDDLGAVARSREFHAASQAMEELVRSRAVAGGWRFSDQQRVLAGQKFSADDTDLMALIAATFARVLPRMMLFTRLMQRGYAGGQRGRVSAGKQASALSRLASFHVPGERDAGLRVWLLYADVKKQTGARHVPSVLRLLSPYPGYLAAVWMDAKKVLSGPGFQRARDELSQRALAHIAGLPVRDHRAMARAVSPADWQEIEEMVDGFARLLPQFALLAAVWQRSFPQRSGQFIAA